MDITVRITQSMGHRLEHHEGLCYNLHGHNYVFEVTLAGNPDPMTGMVRDFSEVKRMLKEFLDPFDHAMVLSSTDPVRLLIPSDMRLVTLSKSPTAENFASLVYNKLVDLGTSPVQVLVRETESGWAVAGKVDRTVRIIGRMVPV